MINILKILFPSENKGLLVRWASIVPILGFLGLSVLELWSRHATDRQTDRRTNDARTDGHRSTIYNAPSPTGAVHNKPSITRPQQRCSEEVLQYSILDVPCLSDAL